MEVSFERAGARAKKKKGLIIVNTGNGKGKTTAALGVALRACGYGMTVSMLQFFKGEWKYGELRGAPKLGTFEIRAMGHGFTWESKDIEIDKRMVREAWQAARTKILSRKYDLVILDEINYALHYGFLPVEDVVDFLRNKPPMLHVILTVAAIHDLNLAGRYFNRLLILHRGSVLAEGAPEAVLRAEIVEEAYGGPVEVVQSAGGQPPIVLPASRHPARGKTS